MSANMKERVAQIRADYEARKAAKAPTSGAQERAPIIQLPVAAVPREGPKMSNTAGAQLADIAQEAAATAADAAVAELNREYFISTEGGRVRVFRESIDPEMGTPSLMSMSPTDFRALFANRFVSVTDGAGNVRKVCVADLWMRSAARREYPNGLALLPGKDAQAGVYNLWRGFGVEAKAGDVKPALQHLRNVICAEDDKAFRYLLGWMARAVQCPGDQAEVAVVVRGGRGTGKGTLGRWMRDIFGAHGMHLLHSRHLTGNFNAHLRTTCFLFADEAFFAGDKAGEGVLKGLVTEDQITIERKGVDAFSARNRLKIMMASNSEWVVPAGTDERRYLVLDVSDCRKQNHAYFAKLNEHMQNGGLAALLDFLLHYDLSGFNVRDVPNTAALVRQKVLSLPPLLSWLHERLYAGRLLEHDSGWVTDQRRDVVVAEFEEYVRRNGLRHVRVSAWDVGRTLRSVFPGMGDGQAGKRDAQGRRPKLWILPDLTEARRQFEVAALSGEPADWPEDGE